MFFLNNELLNQNARNNGFKNKKTLTNIIMHYAHSQNTTILPTSNTPLHWVQPHVSALCIGQHQVVLRLVERLYNKQGILGGLWGWWDDISS